MSGSQVIVPVPESFYRHITGPMSTKHINTAADLVRFGASARIECSSCGSFKTVDGVSMVALCGAGSLTATVSRLSATSAGEGARLIILPPI